MYFSGSSCSYLPQTFDRDHLKLDTNFTYNEKQYVQHQALVTFEQCKYNYVHEIEDYVHGYMTPDEQYCVPECTGVYAPREEGSRICSCRTHVAPDGKTCLASCDNYDSQEKMPDSNIYQCTCKKFVNASGDGCTDACGEKEKEV